MRINSVKEAPSESCFRPVAVFGVLVFVYLVVQTVVGRLPQSSDEVWYKAPGREWAATGRFGAPELVNVFNRSTEVQDVFFLFVPVYSFLFGLVVKAVGFGWRTCVFYDALIAAMLAALTFRLVDLATSQRNRWLALLGGIAVLPLTTHGRPDALATCFGMLAILLLRSVPMTSSRLLLSGMSLGFCAGTSPSAALILGLVGLNQIAWTRSPLRVRVCQTLAWGAAAFVTLGLVVAPILLPHPSSVEQFTLNAQSNVGKEGRLFPLLRMFRDLLGVGDDPSDRLLKLFVKAGLLVGLVSALSYRISGCVRCWLEFWLGPLAGFWLLLTVLSHNPLYYRILTPICIAGIASSLTKLGTLRPKLTAVFCLVLLPCWLASGYIFWRDGFVLLTLPADQQPGFQAQYLPRVVPKGARVLGHGCWWFLADTCRIVDAWWAHPDMNTIDYVVLETGEVFKGGDPGLRPQDHSSSSGNRSYPREPSVTAPVALMDQQTPSGGPVNRSEPIPVEGTASRGDRDSDALQPWCAHYYVNPNIKDPELSYVCRWFRIVEDGTNNNPYRAMGRPLFRRQKGFGCLVLKRKD
jgi:hypothetical protein